MIKLPARQVHLDFHTSELIPGVGSKFDKKQWQAALKAGHVNSVTVFAKCHHSWSYYPTKVGQRHPTLRRNLLGEQIAACHEIGVRAPIYYTVGWSATDSVQHPEWVACDREGRQLLCNIDPNAKPDDTRPRCSWKFMCPSGDYLKLMLAQTAEICRTMPVDGFFYDICFRNGCCCPNCRKGMKEAGLDVNKDADVARYDVIRWQHFMRECNRIIHGSHPEATIFYNGGANPTTPQWQVSDTHFELEDLPTTWGGYDKFPPRARFFANSGRQYLGMSGKFHTDWGEFGGFKHADAIRFEAACMIAYGARISIGDQLHPNGVMDMATYRNIGEAFKYVQKIESYGLDAQPASNLGVWLSGRDIDDRGVVGMLLEAQIDFKIVDPSKPLDEFDAVVLANTRLDEKSAAKLNAFARRGGGVLAIGSSGLDVAGKKFLLDVGAKYVGPANYELDYLVAGKELSAGLVESPFLNYAAAIRVKPQAGTKVLATIREPYFNRTYKHYCSHQNTPNQLKAAPQPGAIRKGNIVYLPHVLGDIYCVHGARVHRQFFLNALGLVYKRPNFKTTMPSAGRATFVHQPERHRYVAHLMYGPPLVRGRCQVIEDLVPLYNVPVEIRVSQKVKRACLAPSGRALPIRRSGGAVKVTVPEFSCHQAVVFEY